MECFSYIFSVEVKIGPEVAFIASLSNGPHIQFRIVLRQIFMDDGSYLF